MRFELLGGLAVWDESGETVRVVGPARRALLAILLLQAGEALTADRLIDELWGERAPPTAPKSLQVHVWRLRKVLGGANGEGPLASVAGGYVLRVEPGELDLEVFERLLGEGRAALADDRPEVASATLARALALWNGPALAEFGDLPFARDARATLEELRLEAAEARIDADLQLGRHRALIAELESLVAANPLRERLSSQLMLALYRCGRQAEALDVYRKTRTLLDQELGLQPSGELRALEQAMLTHDPSLDLAPDQPRDAESDARRAPARRRGALREGLLIASGGALLLAAIGAVVLGLSGGRRPSLRVAPNSVAVIDGRDDQVVGSVGVGARPGAIAFGAGSLWVANADDQTISRINPTSLQPMGVRSVGGTPSGIAASTQAIWVTESDPRESSVSVQRIDPEFDFVGPPLPIGNVVPGGPAAVAARGNAVWVAPSSGLLTHIDAATGQVVNQPIDPNAGPSAIDIGDGAVWVTDDQADNVTRVDPTGLTTPIAVGNGASGIAVGNGGVWVADEVDNEIVRIDPGTRSVAARIPVGGSPAGVAIGEGSVWAANGNGTVTRIDPRTDRVLAKITVGGSPQAITVADGRIWVTVDAQTLRREGSAGTGGTLRKETQIPFDHLDPALAYSGESWQVLYATCVELLNYPDAAGPAGGRLIPEVAQSLPTISADGKTYRFTIRRGFRFSPSSNQPVTAQTFKYTIERALNPTMKAPLAHEFTDIVGARAYMAGTAPHISGVVARGETLTIHLLAPEADFLSLVAQPVFCPVPSNTPADPRGLSVIPSAGPYYVTSYAPHQGAVLLRNPNYRGSRPRGFARIEIAIGNFSTAQTIADIEAGTADYTILYDSTPAGAAVAARLAARYGPASAAARRGRQRYYVAPGSELDFLELNTHRPLFNDTRLRLAVNYDINRRALANLGDGYRAAPEHINEDYLPPTMAGYRDVRFYPQTPDLAKARALAGHIHRNAVLYTCNYPPCDQQAQIIKNDLAAIGITVTVKTFSLENLSFEVARPGARFDLAQTGWTPDYADPSAMLTGILDNPTDFPTLDDARYQRRLAAAGRLTGPQRDLAFGKLAVDLARNAAPLVAWGDATVPDLFSARTGCQTYGVYGLDLAALCTRQSVH